MTGLNNRHGILTNNFLGAIIAIIGIVGLAFLGVKLYGMFVSQDLKNAKVFIEDLNSKIDNLEIGENNTFALRGIKDWVLVGWNKSVPIADEGKIISSDLKPQKCFDKNCLCLCKDEIANCQDVGYCREVDRSVAVLSKLEYSSYRRENAAGILTAYCVPGVNKLMGFFVEKKQNSILVYYDYGKQEESAVTKDNEVLSALSKDGRFLGIIRDNCKIDDNRTYEGIDLPGM